MSSARVPDWGQWCRTDAYTLGAEEEVMLIDPRDWSLAQRSERVLATLGPELQGHLSGETQSSVVELGSSVHRDVPSLELELRRLRAELETELSALGLRAASAGTHPFAVWHETVVSRDPRYQAVYRSMRELARREPTLALHVHVGIPDPEDAIEVVNRMRAHLPVLLALSANSPFWQGRDTGLASARTPLFQAFPRVGIPRVFEGYEDWLDTVELLVRCDAISEPTFLWWDVRPQPRFGTVEVRICDAQARAGETTALVALVQCLVRLECEEGYADPGLVSRAEVLEENRFLAARDGMDASVIDPLRGTRVPVREVVEDLLDACNSHAVDLCCSEQLAGVRDLAKCPGAARQLRSARREGRLPSVVAELASQFAAGEKEPVGEAPPACGLVST